MVFTYTAIRSPFPVTCYMGLDKFENEQLIRTGVASDVWFHVDSLSSAHVYVRLPLGYSWEDLADETVEDMCQLVKNNSIQGCKLASCRVVYTPWANLKKDLVGMDTGTVGFHDGKLRRLRRCDKNKDIVKRIEKSKKEVEWRYDDVKEKWVDDERAWKKGELKKKYQGDGDVQLFDAVEKQRHALMNMGEGDQESGIDEGIKALSSISFAPAEAVAGGGEGRGTSGANKQQMLPEWKVEEKNNRNLPDDDRWFRERGLANSGEERWSSKSDKAVDVSDEVKELREQEAEVLESIYDNCFQKAENENSWVVLVEGYEPSSFWGPDTPDLTVEFWLGLNTYPTERPAVTVTGGGLPSDGEK